MSSIETLYQIVEEAVRKVLAAEKKRKILLVLRDRTDRESLFVLLKELRKTHEVEIICFLLKDLHLLEEEALKGLRVLRSSQLKEASYEALMGDYEGLLVSDLGLLEMKAYQELAFSGAAGKLVFTALKENKPVYGFSTELYTLKNKVLKEKFQEIILELTTMKLVVMPKLSAMRREEPKRLEVPKAKESDEPLARSVSSGEAVLPEKFITLSDLLSLDSGKKVLSVRQDAVLTGAAEEYRKKRGIVLNRSSETSRGIRR